MRPTDSRPSSNRNPAPLGCRNPTMTRIRSAVVCSIVLCAIATLPPVFAAPPEPSRPKLVLAIVVDQFRYDYLLRFRADYHAGFAKLLEQGAVMTDAYMIHSATVTAVGHSTFLSGAPPSASGIIANEWFDRETGKSVTSVSDPTTKIVGGVP